MSRAKVRERKRRNREAQALARVLEQKRNPLGGADLQGWLNRIKRPGLWGFRRTDAD